MIERAHRYGNLVFDRNAIVRAAVRAYVEAVLDGIARFSFAACAYAGWTGDLERGAIRNDNGCGDNEVVAWTEAGVVGLAYELGWGPIEQLGLSVDAVTKRALAGPTELTTDELATLLPIAPDPERWREAQRMLQKVGITWPGSPELPA